LYLLTSHVDACCFAFIKVLLKKNYYYYYCCCCCCYIPGKFHVISVDCITIGMLRAMPRRGRRSCNSAVCLWGPWSTTTLDCPPPVDGASPGLCQASTSRTASDPGNCRRNGNRYSVSQKSLLRFSVIINASLSISRA